MSNQAKASASDKKSKKAWHRPSVSCIDIKRTMAGTGSKSDTYKTANAIEP
jgi:hypothetical protein